VKLFGFVVWPGICFLLGVYSGKIERGVGRIIKGRQTGAAPPARAAVWKNSVLRCPHGDRWDDCPDCWH
jgi:hypothetical protein